MSTWKYVLTSGGNLREAIQAEDNANIAKCLIACYRELLSKLSDEDKGGTEYGLVDDIHDSIGVLSFYAMDPDDEDDINYYLDEFYDVCDNVKAWITM